MEPRIEIRKDNELVGAYAEEELVKYRTMEDFVREHIVPRFGSGRYDITGVNAQGEEFNGGFVTIGEANNG